MRKILALLTIVLIGNPCSAQWKKIADFVGSDGTVTGGEYITCVYFLDLPGSPRIGFVGTESELRKTTDGGISWHSVWDSGKSYDNYYVTDICFKDSLTGWFSIFNGSGGTGDACYRTMDGGGTWTKLPVPNVIYGGDALCYNNSNNRLILSEIDTGIEISTDLGDTWNVISPIYSAGFSFFSDSIGIASAFTNNTGGIMRTTDGGDSWCIVDSAPTGHLPLAISGTPICFESDVERIVIRRSDDYGQTWRVLKDFGPNEDSNFNEISPVGTGVIRGDTTRLYIQTDSGMYISTDQGITWKNNGGPTTAGSVAFLDDKFYSDKGITIAGMTYSDGAVEDGGLWEEAWPQAGVAEEANSQASSSQALLTAQLLENPMKDEIDIAFEMGRTALVSMQLSDVLGRNIPIANAKYQLEQPGQHDASIPAPNLPPGTYYLRITTDVGDAITLKVVKE